MTKATKLSNKGVVAVKKKVVDKAKLRETLQNFINNLRLLITRECLSLTDNSIFENLYKNYVSVYHRNIIINDKELLRIYISNCKCDINHISDLLKSINKQKYLKQIKQIKQHIKVILYATEDNLDRHFCESTYYIRAGIKGMILNDRTLAKEALNNIITHLNNMKI